MQLDPDQDEDREYVEARVDEWLVHFEGDRRQTELMVNHVHVYYLLDTWHEGLTIAPTDFLRVTRTYVALLRWRLVDAVGLDGFEIVVSGEAEAKERPSVLEVSFCSK